MALDEDLLMPISQRHERRKPLWGKCLGCDEPPPTWPLGWLTTDKGTWCPDCLILFGTH